MNRETNKQNNHQDPLGLRELPLLTPATDAWSSIRQTLENPDLHQRQWRSTAAWLAVAASLVLAIMVTTRQSGLEKGPNGPPATQTTTFASVDDKAAAGETIGNGVLQFVDNRNDRNGPNDARQ